MSNNQSNPSSHTTGKVHDNLAIILNPNGTITRIGPNPIALATPDPNTSSPVLTKDLPLNPHHNTWVRIFMPRQALDTFSSTTKYTNLPLIVYFHGGGFILYSAASTFFHNFCVEMTIQAGVAIVSVEHRLAPEHRLPAAYDDAMDALLWIRTSQDVWLRDFTDITRCFIMGTSSGGNIAYHAGLHAAAEVSDLAPLKIRGLVLHEPAFGGTERSGSELRLINDPILPMFLADLMWELALPIGADRDHKYCNPTVDSESSWEKMRKLGWRVMVAGYKGDPMHSSKYRPIRYVSADTYRKNGVPRRIQADIPLRLKIARVSAESRYVSACKRYTSRYTSRDRPILTGSDRYGKEKVEKPLK
ncbi:hypothetical protein CsSME_00001595 [Camellia sinensis var. sinensis]